MKFTGECRQSVASSSVFVRRLAEGEHDLVCRRHQAPRGRARHLARCRAFAPVR